MAARPDQHEHRARLRARFLAAGGDALPDYELIELILFAAIPRQDTKPIAKALIDQFGSFAAVVRASPEALQSVKGVGESASVALKAVEAAACAWRATR